MSFGQGVERIFPFNSKVIDKIEKVRSYKVRRAKLFYIRGLRGKAARLREVDRVPARFAHKRFGKRPRPIFQKPPAHAAGGFAFYTQMHG